jgi:peroxiredoxin
LSITGRSKGLVWLAVGLVGVGGLVVAFSGGFMRSADAVGGGARPLWLEVEAPTAEFATLDGGTASLSDYRGQVVVLNLWGTWCPPCRREIPELADLQEELLGRGATVVSIAVDSGSEEEIRSFADDFGINYPIWISSTDAVVQHFRAIGFPFTLLIDREGLIRKEYLGPQTLESLLADADVWISGSEADRPTYTPASAVGSK